MQRGEQKSSSVWPLIIARMTVGINWFNIAPIFSLMTVDLRSSILGLGYLTFGAFLGGAIFQIPSGILAARLGPKRVMTFGVCMASGAALVSGLSTNLYHLVILRFIVGLGTSFSYGPGLTLIARYFRKGSEGLAVGLFQSTYFLAGIPGTLGWVVFAQVVGWRMSLLSSGALGLASALPLAMLIPSDKSSSDFRVRLVDIRKVILSRRLLLIGSATVAIQTGVSLVAYFLVYFLENQLNVSPVSAGLVGSLASIFSLIASPITGKAYDKVTSPKLLLFSSGILVSLGIGLISLNSLYASTMAAILIGFATGTGFTAAASAAIDHETLHPGYEALAISWVNDIGLIAGFFIPLTFSFTVVGLGYTEAWFTFSIAAFVLAFVSLAVRSLPRTSRARESQQAGGASTTERADVNRKSQR